MGKVQKQGKGLEAGYVSGCEDMNGVGKMSEVEWEVGGRYRNDN